jgi:branched-chain amino acid aminotransferase
MRITVTRGIGRVGLDPRRAKAPSVIAMAYPFPPTLGKKPVRLITSSVRRKSCDCIDPKVKVSNYMDNILAKMQANTAGADDALMLDKSGFVAEATAMNVFVLRHDRWCTPMPIACLEGITRRLAIEILKDMESAITERHLTLHELYVADEIFLTGTAAEITPVEYIDDRKIGKDVPGPETQQIIKRFQQLITDGILI